MIGSELGGVGSFRVNGGVQDALESCEGSQQSKGGCAAVIGGGWLAIRDRLRRDLPHPAGTTQSFRYGEGRGRKLLERREPVMGHADGPSKSMPPPSAARMI
jgi:hypothetical protein